MAAAARYIGLSTNIARLEHDYLERFGVYTRLHYFDRSYTNLEEMQYAAAIAGVLRSYGVQPGDRVLAMLPNTPEMPALLQAIWTIGATAVPIMPLWSALEAGHVLRDCGAACALTVPPLAERLSQAARESGALRHLLVFGESEAHGAENILPHLRAAAPVTSPVDRSSADLALLLYTSGTTGMPKGAMLTHGNVAAALDSFFSLNPDMPRGPMLHVLPFSHAFGLLMLSFANRSGFSSVLLPQFDPVRVLQAIECHLVNYLPVVPTMLIYLLHHPDRGRYNLSSLRRIAAGGAALPEKLREACAAAWPCRIDQGYGLSETFAVAAAYSMGTPYRPGSTGQPAPGVAVRVVDEADRPLDPREVGEICLAGDLVARGYWNDAVATQAGFAGGWFHSGDVGFLDEDGFLYITDRKKDIIIKGGENISPREIEEVLYAHPAVAEAAVVGVFDHIFGEDVWAFVQLRPGAEATEEELRNHVAGFVTRFKVPAHVVFQDALPRSPIGKISKRAIRERLVTDPGILFGSA